MPLPGPKRHRARSRGPASRQKLPRTLDRRRAKAAQDLARRTAKYSSGRRGGHRRFRGQLLGEKNPEVEEQLDRARDREKQVAQSIRRDRPKDYFSFSKSLFVRRNAEENFAFPEPLAGSERGDMRFPEVFVAPGK